MIEYEVYCKLCKKKEYKKNYNLKLNKFCNKIVNVGVFLIKI